MFASQKVRTLKENIDGSVLKKYTNLDKLSCLSLYIFLSFWGNKSKQKPNILHLSGCWKSIKTSTHKLGTSSNTKKSMPVYQKANVTIIQHSQNNSGVKDQRAVWWLVKTSWEFQLQRLTGRLEYNFVQPKNSCKILSFFIFIKFSKM